MKSTALTLIFVFFQYTLWCGANGVWGALSLNKRIKLQQKENIQLLESTKKLEPKVNDLKKQSIGSSSLLEDHMRWKLGLIKKGEWFCHL